MQAPIPAQRPRLALIAAFAVLGSLYALYFTSCAVQFWHAQSAFNSASLTVPQALTQNDFARFWFTGKSLLLRHVAHPAQVWFTPDFPLRIAWLYPPTMNLLAMAFACIPLRASFWAWRLACFMAAGAMLRRAGLSWGVIAAGLLSPAALQDIMDGQNGSLTGSLTVASLLLLESRPRLAGGLAGLLCIKPQMAIALAVILLKRRFRLAISAGLAVALACIAAALALEGIKPWAWFFIASHNVPARTLSTPFSRILPVNGCTVFFMARSFHASLSQAWAAQLTCTAAAVFWLWRVWRAPAPDPVRRMALTVCLSVLITPYGYLYDLVGYALGMAAMFARAPDREKPVFGLLWLMSGYSGTITNLTGCIVLPLAAALGAVFIRLTEKNLSKRSLF